MRVAITLKSSNSKTGPIPVSMSQSSTCPTSCPLKQACYAKGGPLAIHWKRLDKETGKSYSWDEFCDIVSKLPKDQLWRHNQAGDLPGLDETIDTAALQKLVEANTGKKGFTYTHKPLVGTNLAAVKAANLSGFTINASANSLEQADIFIEEDIPVCVVVPSDSPKQGVTPKGNKWVTCPAQLSDKVSCSNCKLCQRSDRSVIIAFRTHGARYKLANTIVGTNDLKHDAKGAIP